MARSRVELPASQRFRKGSVPRLGDQLMENRIASSVLQMLKTERS